MKVMTIAGTRPELIKLSEIIKLLDKYTEHTFVHTGQNFNPELREVFYKDLDLREPDVVLDTGGGTLAQMIGQMMMFVEEVLNDIKPDAVVILGDTNSALTGMIAKRMKIPLFHLEAGNRCFDDNVPEEINRKILDHISDVNLAYTENSRRYLLSEGVAKDRVFVMGSPMYEVLKVHEDRIRESEVLDELKLEPKEYFVVSIHRDENTEIESNLKELVKSLNAIAKTYKLPVIVSGHPRLMGKILDKRLKFDKRIQIMKPFGFLDYVCLQANAKCVISDSGTISEESSILGFPAVTIRNAIERPEAVDVGSILMTGVNQKSILNCIKYAIENPPTTCPTDYGVENCSERVLKIVLGFTPYVRKYVWHE
jgi:UDP-N-acetylglucosamine 2-epimerase (non-hydrolysing)